MKSNFLLVLFCAAALCAQDIVLTVDPASELAADPGAATGVRIPVLAPKFSIRFLKEHFEVVVTVPYLPGKPPRSLGKKNDDERMFGGDTAEFFVSTAPETGVYRQVALNPSGLSYTAVKRDTSWEPRISANVVHGRDFWTASWSIPYREIGAERPVAGTRWRANFAATVPQGGGIRQSASWSGAKSFHDVSQMGEIRFEKKQEPRLLFWEARKDRLTAKLYVPQSLAGSRAVCTVSDRKFPARTEGGSRVWDIPLFEGEVCSKSVFPVEISLLSPEGKVLLDRSAAAAPPGGLDFEPERFYCPAKMETLAWRHTFPLPAKLLLRDGNGKVLRETDAPARGKLALAGLAPGRYILELRSAKLHSVRLIKIVPGDLTVPDIAPEERFSIRDGLFLLGERPVLPVGASHTPVSGLQADPVFDLNAGNIGACKNAVTFRSLGLYRFLRGKYISAHLHPGTEKIVAAGLAQKAPGNRLVLRLAYEAQFPVTYGDPAARVRLDGKKFYDSLYTFLKACRSDRLFSIHVCQWEKIPDYIGSCDIIEVASWKSGYAPDMMPDLVHYMRDIRRMAKTKPVVFWLGGSIPNGECRTAEELRAGVFCAMLTGLNGVIIHLGHGGVRPERSRLWSVISGVNAELREIYPEFVRGKELPGFVTKCSDKVLWSARRCGDRIILAAVNMTPVSRQLEMTTAKGKIACPVTAWEPLVFSWPAGLKSAAPVVH